VVLHFGASEDPAVRNVVFMHPHLSPSELVSKIDFECKSVKASIADAEVRCGGRCSVCLRVRML
jgi:hypothetical protein